MSLTVMLKIVSAVLKVKAIGLNTKAEACPRELHHWSIVCVSNLLSHYCKFRHFIVQIWRIIFLIRLFVRF